MFLYSSVYINEIKWFFFSFRLFPLMTVVLILQLPCGTARKVIVNRHHNKVLVGYSYHNITSLGPKKCLEFCLADCRCLSFQICAASQDCQLSSSTKLLNRSSFQDSKDCDYIEFHYQDITKVTNTTCSMYGLWFQDVSVENTRTLPAFSSAERIVKVKHNG